MVWGDEQLKYCSQLLGESKKMYDMQWFTIGYYFQELYAGRVKPDNYLMVEWAEYKFYKEGPKSKQALYWNLHEDSLVDYLYAEFKYGDESKSKSLGEKLSAYCLQDTLAMMELFNIWQH